MYGLRVGNHFVGVNEMAMARGDDGSWEGAQDGFWRAKETS